MKNRQIKLLFKMNMLGPGYMCRITSVSYLLVSFLRAERM